MIIPLFTIHILGLKVLNTNLIKVKIGVQLNTEKEILNVAYCLDENYNLQMITSLNSFLQHYRGPVKVHILHNNPDSLKEILKLLKNFKNVIRGVCLIVLAILLLELALTFIIVVVLIGIISKILMRFFN